MFHEKEHISKEQTAYLRRTQKRKAAVWLLQVLLLILFFLLWEIAADCGWIDPFLFSQPTELFATAVKMIRDGSLFLHIGTTLRETVIGFLLGTILGTLTAVLLWWNAHFRCGRAISRGSQFSAENSTCSHHHRLVRE